MEIQYIHTNTYIYILYLLYSFIYMLCMPQLGYQASKAGPDPNIFPARLGFGVLQALEDCRFSSGTSEQLGRAWKIQSWSYDGQTYAYGDFLHLVLNM